MAALLSCSQYDDTELRNSLTDLEERIADLEEAVRTEQDNINAINELIGQIKNGVTVDGIEETADGYDIILSNGERISISNGEPGTATESLSLIVKEEDGVWYWAYSDGSFVLIDGERIPVTTEAPQVRINEETGNWEINNGDGWRTTVDEENSVMSITAPAEDNLFAETAGVISVILTDAQGKNFAALLNVAIKILDPEINL